MVNGWLMDALIIDGWLGTTSTIHSHFRHPWIHEPYRPYTIHPSTIPSPSLISRRCFPDLPPGSVHVGLAIRMVYREPPTNGLFQSTYDPKHPKTVGSYLQLVNCIAREKKLTEITMPASSLNTAFSNDWIPEHLPKIIFNNSSRWQWKLPDFVPCFSIFSSYFSMTSRDLPSPSET